MDTYHTQHSPLGAFASFTCGLIGAPGGFGLALGGPATQNLYIGCRHTPGEPWQLLPFHTAPETAGESAYTGEAVDETKVAHAKPPPLPPGRFGRHLGWATSKWMIGPFTFKLHTPWDRTPDPATLDRAGNRLHFAPIVCGMLEYDNAHGESPAELIFGLHDPAQPLRPLGDTDARLAGFASGRSWGFATAPGSSVALGQGFDVFTPRQRDHRGLHLLGHEAALRFTVPAGARRAFPLVLGFFHAGPATSGLETVYWYTRYFDGLEDALAHGLAFHSRYEALAAARDADLMAAPLSPEQRWLVAQATHSYRGSTQLLAHRGRPLWIVNEGEYRMMNTMDLSVDHLFFELEWFPWATRSVLDQFADRYRYNDAIHHPDGATADGGVSFTHDMGVANQFSPRGRSAYECRDLSGCFSHMTMEQLVNWVCGAATYAVKTGDEAWLRRRRALLRACARSLHRRDHPEPRRRDGLLKWDSDRCGPAGSEITTYDSLDVSLGQARNNLYLGVKTLAAWLLLERAFGQLELAPAAADARRAADRLAETITRKFDAETGMFPAVFEAGNQSRILPAVEGLVFPLHLGFADEVRARYPALFQCLESHLRNVLQPGVCLDGTSGAWKISSTSTNTWFSKIALVQHVVRMLFPSALGEAARAADVVHARMQRRAPLGRFAMVDQVRSTDGADIGSRYYPRVVTACLWLSEPATGLRPPGG